MSALGAVVTAAVLVALYYLLPLDDLSGAVRRYERELELFGTNKSSSPTANVVADMLEQLLDETEVVSGSTSPRSQADVPGAST